MFLHPHVNCYYLGKTPCNLPGIIAVSVAWVPNSNPSCPTTYFSNVNQLFFFSKMQICSTPLLKSPVNILTSHMIKYTLLKKH